MIENHMMQSPYTWMLKHTTLELKYMIEKHFDPFFITTQGRGKIFLELIHQDNSVRMMFIDKCPDKDSCSWSMSLCFYVFKSKFNQ